MILGAIAMVFLTIPVYKKLGSEFMPPLDEGTLLYMPSTLPGLSVTEAQKLLQVQDRLIKQFPEVETVLGKAGRAETSTDPAPFFHDGNGRRLEASHAMALSGHVVFLLGPGVGQGNLPAHYPGPCLHRTTRGRNE